jgi:hypothetical protein
MHRKYAHCEVRMFPDKSHPNWFLLVRVTGLVTRVMQARNLVLMIRLI